MAPFNPLMDDDVKSGFWGPINARTDFCEENYATSIYVAEFWNTVTNLAIIFFALIGLHYARIDKLEKRYFWSYYTMIILGSGSLAFHGTLRLDMQIWDQVGMIWLGSMLIYAMFEVYNKGDTNVPLAFVLVVFTAVVTIGVGLPNIVPLLLHRVSFTFLSLMMVGKGFHLLTQVKGSKWLFAYSFFCYLIAFILWNIENQYCPQIREARSDASGPVAAMTQLHGWWHILTGMAAHAGVTFTIYARYEFLKRPCNTIMVFGVVPIVRVFDTVKRH